MGFFSKITDPLNHAKRLEDTQKAYNQKVELYQSKQKLLEQKTTNLYSVRKEGLRRLNALNSYVNSLDGCPEGIILSTKRALEFADTIREAWDFENSPHSVDTNKSKSGGAGMVGAAVVGGATAIGGPATAMAIATTFGTASTGAAISSLGGAAAANAALAWLGGGAVAAGGAGMAGGSAFLAALGPIGWGIAGVAGISFIVSSTFKKKKNDEAIEEIKIMSNRCDNLINKLDGFITQIDKIERHTKQLISTINLGNLKKADKFSDERYPHSLLFATVSNAKNLGKSMRQSVNVI